MDLRISQSNISVASTTIAINRKFKNSEGNYEADFIRVVAFKKTAEILSQHFRKGKQIGLTGSIQTRSYEDKNGNRQYITELVVNNITFINDGSQNNQNQGTQQQNYNQGTNYQNNAQQGGYSQNQPYNQQQNSYTNAYNGQQQQNNRGMEPNPFQNTNPSSGPIDIDDSDLPF